MNKLNNEERTILEYLEHSYSGAKMMNDIDCMNRLSNAIAAFNGDAVPVIHGEWVARDDGILYCSNCRAVKPYDVTDGDSISYWSCDWCRHCGAKMDRDKMQI